MGRDALHQSIWRPTKKKRKKKLALDTLVYTIIYVTIIFLKPKDMKINPIIVWHDVIKRLLKHQPKKTDKEESESPQPALLSNRQNPYFIISLIRIPVFQSLSFSTCAQVKVLSLCMSVCIWSPKPILFELYTLITETTSTFFYFL